MFTQPRTPQQEKLQRYIARHYRRRDLVSVRMLDDKTARITLRDGSVEVLTCTRMAIIRAYFDETI